jgi:hypothetical protein
MIKDIYLYMQRADYQDRYNDLIKDLDTESKRVVDTFIKHINIFYHNNIVHESVLFGPEDYKRKTDSIRFMNEYPTIHPT